MSDIFTSSLLAKAWQGRFDKELKGANLDSLISRNPAEEFSIFPYFTSENQERHDLSGILPEKADAYWEQVYPVYTETSNEQIIEALNFGSNSLYVAQITPHLSKQLDKVQLDYIHCHFHVQDEQALQTLHSYLTKTNQNQFKGTVCTSSSSLIKNVASHFPNQASVEVNTCSFHLNGANIIFETALALALGKEYLQNSGPSPRFIFSVGTDYFLELAKFRSFRLLWANIANRYSVSPIANIQAETSQRECTQIDTDTNILRLTTMAMAALAGTANALVVHPPGTENINTQRIAFNVQNILREESLFGKLSDPGFGAYYIEQITSLLLEQIWSKFLWIESQGGFTNALKNGHIEKEIKRINTLRNQALSEGSLVKIGINKYQ